MRRAGPPGASDSADDAPARGRRRPPWPQFLALAAAALPRCAAQGVVDPNYPPPVSRPTWCEVPNYRYYRFVPSVVRGYRPNAPDDPLSCGAATGQADGCVCGAPDECRSEYCVPDPAMGVGYCLYPIVQIAEVDWE